MIILKIIDYSIPDDAEHLSTTWQLSLTPDFDEASLVLHIIEDGVNLYNLYSNEEITEGTTYYSRCKMILTTGVTEWSNVETGVVTDTNELIQSIRFSTPVTAPEITLVFEDDSQPSALIRASLNVLNIDNNTHRSTTWLIEDINGKILFFSKEDTGNKNSIIIPTVIGLNTVYIIKAKFHMFSGNNSSYGTKVFYTSNDSELFMNYPELILPSRTGNFNVDIRRSSVDFDLLEVEVYQEETNIYSDVSLTGWVSIGEILKDATDGHSFFILRSRQVSGTDKGEWSYKFIRITERAYVLPALFPYNLQHKYTWEPETNVTGTVSLQETTDLELSYDGTNISTEFIS